jgi:hypothetical protein
MNVCLVFLCASGRSETNLMFRYTTKQWYTEENPRKWSIDSRCIKPSLYSSFKNSRDVSDIYFYIYVFNLLHDKSEFRNKLWILYSTNITFDQSTLRLAQWLGHLKSKKRVGPESIPHNSNSMLRPTCAFFMTPPPFFSTCNITSNYCLFVCSLTALCPVQEFFSYMETSPLPMKGCKI